MWGHAGKEWPTSQGPARHCRSTMMHLTALTRKRGDERTRRSTNKETFAVHSLSPRTRRPTNRQHSVSRDDARLRASEDEKYGVSIDEAQHNSWACQ